MRLGQRIKKLRIFSRRAADANLWINRRDHPHNGTTTPFLCRKRRIPPLGPPVEVLRSLNSLNTVTTFKKTERRPGPIGASASTKTSSWCDQSPTNRFPPSLTDLALISLRVAVALRAKSVITNLTTASKVGAQTVGESGLSQGPIKTCTKWCINNTTVHTGTSSKSLQCAHLAAASAKWKVRTLVQARWWNEAHLDRRAT